MTTKNFTGSEVVRRLCEALAASDPSMSEGHVVSVVEQFTIAMERAGKLVADLEKTPAGVAALILLPLLVGSRVKPEVRATALIKTWEELLTPPAQAVH